MTYYDDDDDEYGAKERVLRRIRTEGLEAATDAALKLLRDDKTPAQAKSAAVNAMYRAGGLFDRREDDDNAKPIHEWSAAELDRKVKKAVRYLDALGEPNRRSGEEEDPFG